MFHVLNRGLARRQVFEKAGDYQAFQRVLKETRETLYAHWEEAVELNW